MSTVYSSKTFLFQVIQISPPILIQPIQFNISKDFVYIQLNVETVPFQTIQFSMQNQFHLKNSIWHK